MQIQAAQAKMHTRLLKLCTVIITVFYEFDEIRVLYLKIFLPILDFLLAIIV